MLGKSGEVLFQLLVLRGLKSAKGNIWRDCTMHNYALEVTVRSNVLLPVANVLIIVPPHITHLHTPTFLHLCTHTPTHPPTLTLPQLPPYTYTSWLKSTNVNVVVLNFWKCYLCFIVFHQECPWNLFRHVRVIL